MANIRELLNNPRYHQVREIMVIAGELSLKEDVTAYAVGGCVRDLLLGSSIKDVDLMIEAFHKVWENLDSLQSQ